MRLFHLVFITIITITSCSKENAPTIECRLAKIVVKGNGVVAQTSYTYNSDGQIKKQVRTRNGVTVFDYTYSYTSDGRVDKVDIGDHYLQYQYSPDGEVINVIDYSNTGELNGNDIYDWDGNILTKIHKKAGVRNITHVSRFEFKNDNIILQTHESFTGNEPNVKVSITETRFENFDTALSAFYIASSARPGYGLVSKNNPRKQFNTSTVYLEGSDPLVSTSTTDYTYTYNAANATITSKEFPGNSPVIDTEVTYDQCN